MSDTALRSARLALASLIGVALAAQLLIGLSRDDGLTVIRFLSIFTVLSNTAAVVMLAMLARRPERNRSRGFSEYRGAVTVYTSAAALVNAFTLSDVAVSEPWIVWTLHLIGPVTLALDWLVNPPQASLDTRALRWWVVFPTLYIVYSLARGPLANWYPYPFLDPANGGYRSVAMWSVLVLVVILGFGYVYRWWAGRASAPLATSR